MTLKVHIARVAEPFVDGVAVEHETLSDGSVAWNVLTGYHHVSVRFGCVSEDRARELAEQIRLVTWTEPR